MNECLKYTDVRYDELIAAKSLAIRLNERICIIGKNGAGKSTLLDLLAHRKNWTSGHVHEFKEMTIAYVEQERDVFDLENYNQLSGGEKLIARLTAGFAAKADLLLLDEPTNHLDANHLSWLVKQVLAYKGTIILVSHDRAFLDQVATKVWAIEEGEVVEQLGNYSHYMDVRKKRRLTQQKAYEKQQQEIAMIEKEIVQLSSWSHKAHKESTKQEFYKEYYRLAAKRMDKQIKSKRRQLEKQLEQNKVEKVTAEYTVQFQLAASKKRGKRMVQLTDVTKKFGERILLKNLNATLQFGEKVALIGPNGSGKTTLFNMLLGKESYTGEIWCSPSLQIGYLTQSVFDLPLEQKPAQYFYQEQFSERGKVQNLMKQLGFSVAQWEQPFASMSMGERVKCKLMQFILEGKELLILDEPTNHLDLPSRAQLEETLKQYNGSLLIVSHDRYFLARIAENVWEIQNNKIVVPQQRSSMDDKELLRIQLENKKQEILGKLSFLTPKDPEYAQLDASFTELLQQIRSL